MAVLMMRVFVVGVGVGVGVHGGVFAATLFDDGLTRAFANSDAGHEWRVKSAACMPAGPSVVGPSKTWYNPLESRLPWAPNMTIYALYGVGKETDRVYFYRRNAIADVKAEVGIGF